MIIKPKVRGFVCVTAHPEGCAAHVQECIDYVKAQPPVEQGPKKVLVIGSSTGYGLASRITAAFGSKASTIGLFTNVLGRKIVQDLQDGITPLASQKRPKRPVSTPKTSKEMLIRMRSRKRLSTQLKPILAKSISSFTRSLRLAALTPKRVPSIRTVSSQSANLTPIKPSTPIRESSAPSRSILRQKRKSLM